MTRNVGVSVENTFKGGHITEASGLNFPEHACTDLDNCTLYPKGNITRRLGFDFVPPLVTKTINRAASVVTPFLWKDVGGDAAVNLYVVQIGGTLYFWDVGSAPTAPGGTLATTVTLSTYSPASAPSPSLNPCQFAPGKGFLFVTHPHLEPIALSYDVATETITATQITVEIRDFEGVNDSLAVDNRPTTTLAAMSETHYYNLLNQGWVVANLTAWDTAFTTMPSNADVMWQFKNSSDAFDTAVVANTYRGNSPAPKGHYVLNVFSQQRDTVSGRTITDVTTTYQRTSTCAFFAGRVFYGGINATGFSNRIMFSQILEGTGTTTQFGKCYQLNDPTSEDAFELLPSDGGVVFIPEMGQLIKLVAIPGSLIAFASNGIWSVSGSTGIGFTATDYTVQKISTVATISSTSFIEAEGSILWWNGEAIWVLQQGQGGMKIDSLTGIRNQTYFNTIPPVCKQKAIGGYNPLTRTVQWMYSIEASTELTQLYEFTNILVFDFTLGSFYKWSLDPTHAVKLHGVFPVGGGGGVVVQNNVVRGADQVIDASGNLVIDYDVGSQTTTPQFRYLVSYADSGSYKFTFAEERDVTYMDWETYTVSSNFDSYFISGYRIRGDAQKKFQTNYLYMFSNNTEVGLNSYYVQGLWDYANTGNSGRWSSRQIEQSTDTNFDLKIRRFKMRGTGIVMQLKITSVDGEPFDLAGWSTLDTNNAAV